MFSPQNTHLWLFHCYIILLTFDKKINSTMISYTIALTYKEATQVLKSNYKQMMENSNWNFIAIREDSIRGCFFAVGVYDFDKEKQILKDAKSNKIRNLKISKDSIEYMIPKNFMKGDSDQEVTIRVSRNYLEEAYQSDWNKILSDCNQLKGKCDTRSKRKMGQLLANLDKINEGSIGCFLSDKNGVKYALTAYHVVRGSDLADYSDIGNKIESPPGTEEILGTLCWYKFDDYIDIALIKLDSDVSIDNGSVCCFNLKEHMGAFPKAGQWVKICSSINNIKIKCGVVLSTCCVVRRQEDHDDCFFGLAQTTDIGAPGDSGSVVTNEDNEAVGLLLKDEGLDCSYFMPLDILNKKIKLKTDNSVFEFEKFY